MTDIGVARSRIAAAENMARRGLEAAGVYRFVLRRLLRAAQLELGVHQLTGVESSPLLKQAVQDAADLLSRSQVNLEQIGWVLHVEPDGGNDAFWWADKYPTAPAAGAEPVYRFTAGP